MSQSFVIPVGLAVCCIVATLASNWAIRRALAVPTHKRPRLALLERWYAASPKRRRVTAAIFDWKRSLEDTRAALRLLRRRFPTLASNFHDGEWVAASSGFDVEVFESESWEQVSEKLLCEDMTSPARLFRAGLCTADQTLVLMLDHVLTDGQGLAGLVQALLESDGKDAGEISIPLALEEHVDLTPRIGILLKHILGGVFKRVAPFKEPFYVGEERAEVDQSLLESCRLSPASLSALSLKCKAENTSIHGALCAAASLALTKVTPTKDTIFELHCPISLRGQGPFQPALGNYVGPSELMFTPGQFKDAWALARHIKSEIEEQRPFAGAVMGQLNLLDMPSFLKQKENLPSFARSATIEVSNLGRCNTTQEWAFAQGNHYVGPLLVVNAVASSSGVLWLTITARSLCVNRAALQTYRDAVLRSLEEMTR